MATSVTVLMGGWSSEREVSLVSGNHVAGALIEAGYDVRTVDVQRDIASLVQALTTAVAGFLVMLLIRHRVDFRLET